MADQTSFPTLLEAFFTRRLIAQRRASPHTVAAYRYVRRFVGHCAATRTCWAGWQICGRGWPRARDLSTRFPCAASWRSWLGPTIFLPCSAFFIRMTFPGLMLDCHAR